ncbi:hypothetical protein LSTR_LSTR004211 [Laodelphax striatellus]|uniref:Uncharacterized protein n=1 Tax=Laodelphax striatellus TaxID=195883 RepID=A0A482X9I2_LAOST|nr:hypothetical protein LSTR_LSTR004211 [Laodelphax striatellus]
MSEREEKLKRLAEAELLKEAKAGAARAEVSGPTGWKKCTLRPTNKRFLQNTILQTIASNKTNRSKIKAEKGESNSPKPCKKLKKG